MNEPFIGKPHTSTPQQPPALPPAKRPNTHGGIGTDFDEQYPDDYPIAVPLAAFGKIEGEFGPEDGLLPEEINALSRPPAGPPQPKNTVSDPRQAVAVSEVSPSEHIKQLESEVAALLRRITAARGANHAPFLEPKSRKEPVHHTSVLVKRVSSRGLDGEQPWREFRKKYGVCSTTDGWNKVAEIPDVLLVLTWHREKYDDDYVDCPGAEPEDPYQNTYVVVDRSRQYKPTDSLKYATEVFMFACMNELQTRLSR